MKLCRIIRSHLIIEFFSNRSHINHRNIKLTSHSSYGIRVIPTDEFVLVRCNVKHVRSPFTIRCSSDNGSTQNSCASCFFCFQIIINIQRIGKRAFIHVPAFSSSMSLFLHLFVIMAEADKKIIPLSHSSKQLSIFRLRQKALGTSSRKCKILHFNSIIKILVKHGSITIPWIVELIVKWT